MKTKTVFCPTCRKAVAKEDNTYWPFCSERCKTSDLGSWAKEDYRIATNEKPVDEEEGENNEEP
ncbi:MAG: DNA gyrase inhibitor YacG [Deltaproteobacteria bacterium]|nr:DNA gyrase inhibitor YacG [Deltaproteobacteria bacterium]